MAFIFCGSSIPEEVRLLDSDKRNSTVSPATSQRESYLLGAIKASKYKKVFFVTSALSDNKVYKTQVISVRNITYVLLGSNGTNRYFRFFSLIKSFFKWLLDTVKSDDIVCVYNFSLIFAIPILTVKVFKSFELMIDMEDRFNPSDYRYYINYVFEYIGIKAANYFLASSPEMSKHIKSINNDGQMHVNGGYVVNLPAGIPEKKTSRLVNVCYFGSLDRERGVLDLIHSFSLNKDEKYRLIITGSGMLEGLIKAHAIKDKRIQFLGLLDNDKFKDVLLSSDVCVNPQDQDISINFPSKVTMYLSYGKLVLSTRHSALYETDYNSFVKFYDRSNDQSNENFWNCLHSLVENNSFSSNAEVERRRQFHKTATIKTNRLIDYIDSTINTLEG